MQNATLLSVVYLTVSLFVEGARRFTSFSWAERLSLALDAFPARVLEATQLLWPVRRALIDDTLNAFTVRLVFGLTSIVVIFALAAAVGAVMWLGRWAFSRSTVDR